ncbi:MAG TPA: PA2169 family four-helix-bundle protein [Candidatus Sulfotelmatobacter sp.]|nr:PA2169 family four-helix-bundle protein [Candidatus Sulfotelmatobacter sp.]
MDQKDAIDVLEHLIERCRDGHNGFREAAEKVKRTDLKTWFNEVSLERGRFAEELQNELVRVGKPDKRVSGSTEGALHRAWLDTKQALGGDDHTVLDWLEHGEDVAKDAYQKAITSDLPENIALIVRRQADSVRQVHDRVKMLRDTAKAA